MGKGTGKDPPAEFLCSITGELMREPVKLVQTGASYEGIALEEYLRKNPDQPRCPVTSEVLEDVSTTKDVDLACKIDSFLEGDKVKKKTEIGDETV
jgi:hypothetical protein